MSVPAFSIPIVESPYLPDDQMFISSDHGGVDAPMVVLVGTMSPDPIKQAGRDGRLAVRRGLADVLEWLGEDVETEPLMTRIRNLAASGERGLPSWFRASPMPKDARAGRGYGDPEAEHPDYRVCERHLS